MYYQQRSLSNGLTIFFNKTITTMKKILSLLAASLLLMTMFVSTGCEDDPVDEPKISPILDLSSNDLTGGEITFEMSDVAPVSFTLVATPGTDDLNTFNIGGVSDLGKLAVTGGSSGIGSNTVLLSGADRSGFAWDVVYTPDATIGVQDLTFSVTDDGGLSSGDVDVRVTVIEDVFVGTPIDTTMTGILFNQQNPDPGTGSLDLDEGKGSGVSSDGEVPKEEAEIRDMGLDCSIAPADFNWRRQIGAFNGTEIRMVDLMMIENFTFDGVAIKEDIVNAFDTGVVLSSDQTFDCGTGDPTGTVEYVTPRLAEGDMFVVSNGTTYYLVRVDTIDEDGGAMNTNKDSYTLSIKR